MEWENGKILSKAYRILVLDFSRNITAISLLLRLRLVLFGYGYGYGYDLSSSVTAITAISVMLFLFCSVFTLITHFRLAISSFFKFRLSFSALPQNPSFPSRVFALLFVFVFFPWIPKEKFRNKTYSRNSRREKNVSRKENS